MKQRILHTLFPPIQHHHINTIHASNFELLLVSYEDNDPLGVYAMLHTKFSVIQSSSN